MSAGREVKRQAATAAGSGWFAILKRTLHAFGEDRVMAEAAGVTFYALLAIFPAIAALVSIWGFFADPGAATAELSTMAGIFPAGMMQVIREEMTRVAAQNTGALGIGFFAGLAISLWFASSGMKGLFDALNVVYGERETRGFFRLSAIALLFTIGSLVVILLGIGAVIALPIIFGGVGFGSSSGNVISVLRWPALLIVMALALAVLYRYGPSRPGARLRWITWGNVLASLMWVGGSLLFTWYVANFGSYNRTYGSLGAVAGFMTWMWLSSIVILLGAALDSEIERQSRAAKPG
jgi:membrane protein